MRGGGRGHDDAVHGRQIPEPGHDTRGPTLLGRGSTGFRPGNNPDSAVERVQVAENQTSPGTAADQPDSGRSSCRGPLCLGV